MNSAVMETFFFQKKKAATAPPELLQTNITTGGDTLSDTTGFGGYGSQTGSNETLEYTTGDHQAGAGCIKLTSTYAGNQDCSILLEGDGTFAPTSPYILVSPGKEYALTLQGKCSHNGVSDKTYIRWYNSSSGYLSATSSSWTTTSTNWVERTLTATAPANAARAVIGYQATLAQTRWIEVDTCSFKATS